MRVLWLTSWYPNELNPFNGDFIQRHARAASLFNNIDVMHVEGDNQNRIAGTSVRYSQSDQLSEKIILLRLKKGSTSILINQFIYLKTFKSHVDDYIKKHGVPDLIHVHVPVKAGLLGIYLKRRYKIPFVLTEHAGIYQESHNSILLKPKWFKILTRKVFESCDSFLPVSEYAGKGVSRLIIKKKFSVIPNTVDTNLFNYRPIQNEPDIFRFIHVSGMNENKNPTAILSAFKIFCRKFPNAELIMVGNDALQLHAYTKRLRFDPNQVKIKGEMPYANVADELRRSHAFILFSHMENSPCVIIEALCCGLPVVSSNVGGINELIDASNGILTETYAVKDLCRSMKMVFEQYATYDRAAIARKAAAEYSYESVGSQIADAYKKLKMNITAENAAR